MNCEFEEVLREFMEEHPNKKKPKKHRRNKYKYKDYKKKALRYEDYSIRKNIKSKYYDFKKLTYDDLTNVKLETYQGQVYININLFKDIPVCDFSDCYNANSVKDKKFEFKNLDSVFYKMNKEDIDNIKEFILEVYNHYCGKQYSYRFYYNLYNNPNSGETIKVNYTDKEKKLLNFFDKYNKINNYYNKMYIIKHKSNVKQTLREIKKEYNTSKNVDTDKIHRVLAEEYESVCVF